VTGEVAKDSLCDSTVGVVVDGPLNPDTSYSNAEEVTVAGRVYEDQGSGELERGGAKGSSNGFSSKAREDCCKRSSKPDMTVQFQFQSFRLGTKAITIKFPTAILVLYS